MPTNTTTSNGNQIASSYTSYSAKDAQEQTRTYNSYSGCDMVAMCEILGTQVPFGTLQTISYSVHMERHPVRSIGNINAKDYTQGPRTIAGSLVFAVFDKHILYHMYEAIDKNRKNNKYSYNSEYLEAIADYQAFYSQRHMLADELPPFNIIITFANEYGSQSKLALYGVRLVNEGQVMSINDVYIENTYQFVAVDIDYMSTTDEDSKYDYTLPTVVSTKNGVQNVHIGLDIPSDESSLHIQLVTYNIHTQELTLKLWKQDDNSNVYALSDGVISIADGSSKTINFDTTATESMSPFYYFTAYNISPQKYSIIFKESDSEKTVSLVLDLLSISDQKQPAPFISNVFYLEQEKYLEIMCPSAITASHNAIFIKELKEEFKILDGKYSAYVPCSKLKDNNIYTVYSYISDGVSKPSQQIKIEYDSDVHITLSQYINQFCTLDNDIKLIINSICKQRDITEPNMMLAVYAYVHQSDGIDGKNAIELNKTLLTELVEIDTNYLTQLNPASHDVKITNSSTARCTYVIVPSINSRPLYVGSLENNSDNPVFYINDHWYENSIIVSQLIDKANGSASLPNISYQHKEQQENE